MCWFPLEFFCVLIFNAGLRLTRVVCGQVLQVLSLTLSFLHWLVEMVIEIYDLSQCCHLFVLSMACCHTTLELCVLWKYDMKHILLMDSCIF